jgi:hypothetical protein
LKELKGGDNEPSEESSLSEEEIRK